MTLEYEWSVIGFSRASFTVLKISHGLHRTRRAAVVPFFSKTLVQQVRLAAQIMSVAGLHRCVSMDGVEADIPYSLSSVTVAHILSVTSYHIIAHSKVLRQLQKELDA